MLHASPARRTCLGLKPTLPTCPTRSRGQGLHPPPQLPLPQVPELLETPFCSHSWSFVSRPSPILFLCLACSSTLFAGQFLSGLPGSAEALCFLPPFLFHILKLWLIYSVVSIFAVQQSDPSSYIHILFLICSPVMVCPRRPAVVPCAVRQDLVAYSYSQCKSWKHHGL